MSHMAPCSYFFLNHKNYNLFVNFKPELSGKAKNGTILFNLVNFTMYFHIFGEKSTLKVTKKLHFCLKGDFEPQYFKLRTIKNLVNFSIKNVLKISPKLRLSVLINFVLIKKRVYCIQICYELQFFIVFFS